MSSRAGTVRSVVRQLRYLLCLAPAIVMGAVLTTLLPLGVIDLRQLFRWGYVVAALFGLAVILVVVLSVRESRVTGRDV